MDDDNERPEWASKDGFEDIALHTIPSSGVAIEINYTASDDELAVSAQLVVKFDIVSRSSESEDEAPVPFGSPEELTEYLVNHGEKLAGRMMNEAISDSAPYLREIVHSASGRLRPEKPIVLAGDPSLMTVRRAQDDIAETSL
ncbi:hypothetical protein [Rhodococcus erythropolis]|uniref:hypothetical protein n=1 Tax=Rhodococcus erythropolis TaxID=1833 RepID=UPI001BE8B848|nr:hypothetical protein [Rhodococcus erythropolis]MBT2265906.1 hypothetical protein [Rhodococcus erythropolis]